MSKSCTKCKLSIVLSNQSMHPTVNLAVSVNPTITLLIKCDHKCSLKTFLRHSGVVLAPVTYRKYVEHGASSIFFFHQNLFHWRFIHSQIDWTVNKQSLNVLLEERQLKVDLDQEEASAKPSLEEWLCRREKRAALSSGRYVLNP